jgi:formylglycine-generating enzyme required for sulfatase activity
LKRASELKSVQTIAHQFLMKWFLGFNFFIKAFVSPKRLALLFFRCLLIIAVCDNLRLPKEQFVKDAFISYARKESIILAARIYRSLRLTGFEAWFDKVNIPHGQDYQQRIYQGIESAHNFIFIISPSSVNSPYCRLEIDHAVRCGKRIIPLLHINLSEKEALKLHPVLQRIDWIYAREVIENFDEFNKWRNQFENFWKELEDYQRLQDWQPPQFGETVDDFERTIQKILDLIGYQYDYVKKYTQLLIRALTWDRAGKDSHLLLVGVERSDAENWLKTQFLPPDQPPCEPNFLVCEFLAESRKNAFNMMSSVYISYEDNDFMEQINYSLMRQGFSTSMTERNSSKQKPMETEEIESADTIVWLRTPLSEKSALCQQEIAYAASFHKRIVVLRINSDGSPTQQMPEGTIFIEAELDSADRIVEKTRLRLLSELSQNLSYYEEHKIYLTKALKWKRQNFNNSILLQGYDLQRAESFLKAGSQLPHKPTELHQSFIDESIAKSGLLQTEVFISYSRTDGDFARRLNEDLQAAGKTTWFDQDSIAKAAANFQQEIFKGIEKANNFVFIISPRALQSSFCEIETRYAVQKGKRIITLLIEPPGDQPMPSELAAVQWIDFKNHDFYDSFGELLRTLDTDRDHVAGHTKWGLKASEWLESNKDKSLLLGQIECSLAEVWLREAFFMDPNQKIDFQNLPNRFKNPRPTELQLEYIGQSRSSLDAIVLKEAQDARRLRNLLFRSNVALVISILFLFTSLYFIYRVEILREEAEQTKESLQVEKENALKLKARSDNAARATREALDRSLIEKRRADSLYKTAQAAQERALQNEKLARKSADKARQSEFEAKSALEKSIVSEQNALQARAAADSARVAAEKARLAAERANIELKLKEQQLFENYYYNAEAYVQEGNYNDLALQLENIRTLRPDTFDAVALKLAVEARDFYFTSVSERLLRNIRNSKKYEKQISYTRSSLAMISASMGRFEKACQIIERPDVLSQIHLIFQSAAAKGQEAAQSAQQFAYLALEDAILKTIENQEQKNFLKKYNIAGVFNDPQFARAYQRDLTDSRSTQERVGGSFLNILKNEVTVEMYRLYTISNPGTALPIERLDNGFYVNIEDNLPAVLVSYEDATNYCQWLSKFLRIQIRIPTAQLWTLLAQKLDSTQKPLYKFSGSNTLNDVGWYELNSKGRPQPVRKKMPNSRDLFDMSGNVAEWTSTTAKRSRGYNTKYMIMGGSYRDREAQCSLEAENSALKFLRATYIGFRFIF